MYVKDLFFLSPKCKEKNLITFACLY